MSSRNIFSADDKLVPDAAQETLTDQKLSQSESLDWPLVTLELPSPQTLGFQERKTKESPQKQQFS